MIPKENTKVSIYITTYSTEFDDIRTKPRKTMDRRQNQNNAKRFLCSICLNKPGYNDDCGNKSAKACPICHKQYTCDYKKHKINDVINAKRRNTEKDTIDEGIRTQSILNHTKDVQTSQTDLTQDLSLLKEVLTVFQSKKQLEIKTSKTVIMKDVSVETESASKIELKTKLTKSRIFQFSIEEDNKNSGNSFKIVNYSQPNAKSQYSMELIKHKSSSIPQMKLEELKYSLKEKTKSKDAIEEVNRMFATVRRSDLPDVEEQNRPMIRNGPRVLPVVKTKYYEDTNKKENSDSEGKKADRRLPHAKTIPYHKDDDTDVDRAPHVNTKPYHKGEEADDEKAICKCCQTNNMHLSGGDSFLKHECCYQKMLCQGRCEKCVYMMCCHYQKRNKVETGALICECCMKNADEKFCDGCEGNRCDHF